jgi:hypothetical protein
VIVSIEQRKTVAFEELSKAVDDLTKAEQRVSALVTFERGAERWSRSWSSDERVSDPGLESRKAWIPCPFRC